MDCGSADGHLNDVDRYGEPYRDDTYLICLNPHHERIKFFMPACTTGCAWEMLLDTANKGQDEVKVTKTGEDYDIWEHSAVVFREAIHKEAPQPVPEPVKAAVAPRKPRKKLQREEEAVTAAGD